MPYKQQFKQVFKETGKEVSIDYYGVTYEGIVVDYEGMNPNNAHVTIEQEDGTKSILPISENMVVNIFPEEDAGEKKQKAKNEEIENEDLEDEEVEEDAYEDWDLKALKKECRNRGIKFKKGVRKSTLTKALKDDDAES